MSGAVVRSDAAGCGVAGPERPGPLGQEWER